MNYVAKFRPELVDDVAEAYRRYEERVTGLGHDLIRKYYAAVTLVERNPEMFPKAHSEFRRVLLRRFPYALYFRIQDDVVLFVLLFPCARDPRLLRRTLRERRND